MNLLESFKLQIYPVVIARLYLETMLFITARILAKDEICTPRKLIRLKI